TVGSAGNARVLGLNAADHGVLGAAMTVAGSDEWLLTGRLSATSQQWLADHVMSGLGLVPGTVWVDAAVRAGDEVGCGRVEELMVSAPLVLPERGGVQLQVRVGTADEYGRREISIYAREEGGDSHLDPRTPVDAADGGGSGGWRCHATGVLAPTEPPHAQAWPDGQPGSDASEQGRTAWPPADAQPLDVETFYADLAQVGYAYGPAFHGLTAAWRGPAGDLFAEVALPQELHQDAECFGIHPALLDAAVHAVFLRDQDEDQSISLPFAYHNVHLHATGATALRVRITASSDDTLSAWITDPAGEPVASIESLTTRPVDSQQLQAEVGVVDDSILTLAWVALTDTAETEAAPSDFSAGWVRIGDDGADLEPDDVIDGALPQDVPGVRIAPVRRLASLAALSTAVEEGMPVPDVVVAQPPAGRDVSDEQAARDVHASVLDTLRLLQEWLTNDMWESSLLVVVTRGVVPADGDVADLSQAAASGLVRSAQSENPGRILLADCGSSNDESEHLPKAVAAALRAGESQILVRDGVVQVPRLARSGVRTGVPVGARQAESEGAKQ
uniref:polyketide synthase dehydratase domain-containing protein n=1 Tax=Streptomyces aculeolatus TaxID=270689 RepID=UPI001CECF47A